MNATTRTAAQQAADDMHGVGRDYDAVCQSCGKGAEAGYLREVSSRLLDVSHGTGRYQHLDCDRF